MRATVRESAPDRMSAAVMSALGLLAGPLSVLLGVLLGALLAAAPAGAASGPPVAVEGGVFFSYEAPSATTVHLAGEFNSWNPTANAMSDEDGDGVWEIVIPLQTGRTYEYKYVIDGGVSWREDPHNPNTVDDDHGGVNTVLSIADDGSVVLGYLAGAEGTPVYEPVVDELELLGTKLKVAIVWHQHQPKYLRDLETGEYAEPWVRMHCIKDYYDMVSILAEYPNVRFTVNLTPILLMQIDDVIEGYDSGSGTDEYLRMTLKDASTLTMNDKVYLLTHFFNAHWENKIHIWPRYKALKDMKGGDTRAELEAAAGRFSEQDWRDLQMWFNLAWFDPDFQEGFVTLPDGSVVTVRHLIDKAEGFTELEKAEMVATQMGVMKNVVAVHREARERGQIEVITTPFYHPILPLIYDTDLASVAMPGTQLPEHRFSYPSDAEVQVGMAADYYEELFGAPPVGLWPGEGAVAQEIVGSVARGGFDWMASDDQVLQKSLGEPYLSTRQKYQMYWTTDEATGSRVAMIFRDHRLSDDIGFNFGKMDGVDAANSMMRSLYSIHKQLADDERVYVVPIILDGENAWEWYRHDGKEFFHSWYDQLGRAKFLETTTVEDYLAEHPPTETLPRLWAGSWINNDFSTWIGETEENKAWDYLARVRSRLLPGASSQEGEGTERQEALERAYQEILAAEGSDWFWWYGKDQDSANDGAFDEIFRGTLANVYTLLGEEPPAFLSEPVLTAGAGASAGGTAGAGDAAGSETGGVMARAENADEAELLAGPVFLPDGVLFSHANATAKTVHLAGEFNGWNPTAQPMSDEDGDGVWTVTLELEPGRYEYKFVIDGGAAWEPDAGNPERVNDNHGGENTVVVVP